MKILVVGGGGRENALCRALSTATEKPSLIIAPGNGGTQELGKNVPVAADDIPGLVQLARDERVDLVLVGPEVPLVLGLADALEQAGIPCCGPKKKPAELEGSKAFMRTFTHELGVPGPSFVVSRREAELGWALDAWQGLPVVKADGLCAGKGVVLPDSKEECLRVARGMLRGDLGAAGREVVLEERLVGIEASLFFACDGELAVPLPHAKDHKRIFDADQGPNTGGMGAVSPNPVMTPEIEDQVKRTMIDPVLRELTRRGTPFRGFLFAGLMLTREGPKLLEFNVRLGDPETQAVLPRLAPGDFLKLVLAMVHGTLGQVKLTPSPLHTCAVVLAAPGYPETPRTGDPIFVTTGLDTPDRWLDHAGTVVRSGKLVTNGGRVATVVGRAKTLDDAKKLAYAGVQHVTFNGVQYRRDIGG